MEHDNLAGGKEMFCIARAHPRWCDFRVPLPGKYLTG